MGKPLIYYLEVVQNKPLYIGEIEEYAKAGKIVEIHIDLKTAFNEELFTKACEKFGLMGCKIVISTDPLSRDIFEKDELQILAHNLKKAQPFVNEEIKFDKGFTLSQASFASQKIDSWANKINEATVFGRSLSPFEKYIYCYTIAAEFTYKSESEGDSPYVSRTLPLILDPSNDKIVCVGFSELLTALCQKCKLPISYEGIELHDNPYGHAVNTVFIKDSFYGLNNIFRADPTLASYTNNYGPTLAGIWTGYKTISTYFKKEAPDNDLIMQGEFGIPKPSNFEAVSGLNAIDQPIRFGFGEKNEGFDYEQNYRERIKSFLFFPIKQSFKEEGPRKITSSHETFVLDDVRYNLKHFCSYGLYEILRLRSEEITKLTYDQYHNPEELQDELEKILTKYNNKITKSISKIIFSLREIGYSEEKATETIFAMIDEFKLSDFDQRLIQSETVASKYYLFGEEIKRNSKELDPLVLILATRNVMLSKGCNLIEANIQTSKLIAGGAIIEFLSLMENGALNSNEIFASLFDSKIIPSQILMELEKEFSLGEKILEENSTISPENRKPISRKYEKLVYNLLKDYIHSVLITTSFEEAGTNLEQFNGLLQIYNEQFDYIQKNSGHKTLSALTSVFESDKKPSFSEESFDKES